MVKLFPALRDRENPCNFYPSQTRSATDGALNVSRTAGEFYEVKLTGRNCMDAISTRLRGPFQSGLGSIGFRFYLLFYRNRPECAGKDRTCNLFRNRLLTASPRRSFILLAARPAFNKSCTYTEGWS